MSAQVTVTLPDDLLDRARAWADQSGRPLSSFLAETIAASLASLGDASFSADAWTDDEVLAALDYQLPAEDDRRLSDLLARQVDEMLSDLESAELRRLMALYEQRLLGKSIAVREAVRRGLRQAPVS